MSRTLMRTFALLALVWFAASCGVVHKFEQIGIGHGEKDTRAAVPAGSFVVELASPQQITAPFVVGEDPLLASGYALLLPEGAGSARKTGKAVFTLQTPTTGVYYVWAYVLWRDSCGNSFSVQIDDLPAYLVGQDALYNTWHWVKAGRYNLEENRTHKLVVQEREDGIAVGQFLFTPQERFVPSGPFRKDGSTRGIRRFADDFARSPGHGLEAWDLTSGHWEIAFSLDPNRIPNQYALVGQVAESDTPALALIKGPDWEGCRLEFSVFPEPGSCFGAVLERAAGDAESALQIEFFAGTDQGTIHVSSLAGRAVQHFRGLRASQWHRIGIDRWAWILRILVDDEPVFQQFDLEPRPGGIGLVVRRGSVFFDDLTVEEVPWQAEDGERFRLPWRTDEGALWYRVCTDSGTIRLKGRRGVIRTCLDDLPVQAVFLETSPEGEKMDFQVLPSVLKQNWGQANIRFFTTPVYGEKVASVGIGAGRQEVLLRRVAVAYGEPVPDFFRCGLYHFTTAQIEDPSDYLDFTEVEYKEIKSSPDAQKLIRRTKWLPLLGGGKAVWNPSSGTWFLREGVLVGRGPEALLRYWDRINFPLLIRTKVRQQTADAVVEVCLTAANELGLSVRLGGESQSDRPVTSNCIRLAGPSDDRWHELEVAVGNGIFSAALDRNPQQLLACERGFDSELWLKVARGTAEFDDIELLVPRSGQRERFYAFDRRETDWWREGGAWIDHGGIACMSGSTWISLVAPSGEGMLWNKRRFGPDVLLSFKIEENTEWFGWARYPTHVHYPFDNIRASLICEEKPEQGYTLEINARNRSATVLYRNGQQVAVVEQGKQFPIRYHGGHAPYSPRRNTIALAKQKNLIEAYVNGQRVLRFEDPNPLPVSRVGLGGYRTRVNFSEVVVRNL
ncbi:MAG: hypothetical protein ACUVWX_02380 [Kiritimatiellia bacterium]